MMLPYTEFTKDGKIDLNSQRNIKILIWKTWDTKLFEEFLTIELERMDSAALGHYIILALSILHSNLSRFYYNEKQKVQKTKLSNKCKLCGNRNK